MLRVILGGDDPMVPQNQLQIAVNSYVKSFFNYKKNKNFVVVARAGNVIKR